MAPTQDFEALRKGIASFGLAVAYRHEEASIGRGAATQNLRLGLKREGLWRGAEDEQLLQAVRNGAVDFDALMASVCSFERTGYRGALPPDTPPPPDSTPPARA